MIADDSAYVIANSNGDGRPQERHSAKEVPGKVKETVWWCKIGISVRALRGTPGSIDAVERAGPGQGVEGGTRVERWPCQHYPSDQGIRSLRADVLEHSH